MGFDPHASREGTAVPTTQSSSGVTNPLVWVVLVALAGLLLWFGFKLLGGGDNQQGVEAMAVEGGEQQQPPFSLDNPTAIETFDDLTLVGIVNYQIHGIPADVPNGSGPSIHIVGGVLNRPLAFDWNTVAELDDCDETRPNQSPSPGTRCRFRTEVPILGRTYSRNIGLQMFGRWGAYQSDHINVDLSHLYEY